MIKLKLILLFAIIILTSNCTEMTVLLSAGSMAASQNTLAKTYNGLDFLTFVTTKKDIKKHIYDKGKKHVQTLTRITNN